MAQQKSDRGIVPEGPRKLAQPPIADGPGAGKAATVNEQGWLPGLPPATAERSTREGKEVDGGAVADRSVSAPFAKPKAGSKKRRAISATMEEVAESLDEALDKVASNKGAPGPDRQSAVEVRRRWSALKEQLIRDLLSGAYRPGEIRRVMIPKPGGGERGLGIPNVIDRVVQEAVREVLEPLYEPTFHPSSHGFRPERSCHTAIAEAVTYADEGHEWVVDLDLEKFFDRVNHQRLLARLSQRVQDRRLLELIGRMLKAKVLLPDGVVVNTEEGVPQGGPLSPLLSNIVLDELDWELARRGHRFVRYADDCNIYVRSERAGQRVMASVTRFISNRLRLKVNEKKSAVARPEERHFLGFRLRRAPLDGRVNVLLSKRSKERIDGRIRELTPRNWGGTLEHCIKRLNVYLRGWIGYFMVCTPQVEGTLLNLDAHIRRRLRAIQLKHWKRKRTAVRNLRSLGVMAKTAWRGVYGGRKSFWALSACSVVHRGLRNAFFAKRGLLSLLETWQEAQCTTVAPEQLALALG